MPDHIHFLVHGKASSAKLIKFVSAFKQKTAYRCQKGHGRKLWQPRCCEHILRKAEDFESVALYIWNNPVRLKKTILNVEPPFRAALSFTRIDFQIRFASDQGDRGLTRQMNKRSKL